MSRFPFGTPLGWYPVAWSFEVEAGQVARRQYFGRDLVVFRGESGEASVLDAYCPHLGAHLGVGGKVEGDTIRCPFHGWKFGAGGECVEIPYAKRVPPSAKAKAYSSAEIGGMIWAWYHPQDDAPSFDPPEIPEFGEPGWMPQWKHYEWKIRTHPQEVAENSVDWPHLHEVHLMDPPDEATVRFEGHEILWTAATTKRVSTLEDASDEIKIIGRNAGLGSSYVKYTGMGDSVIVMGMTPIDDEMMHMRFGVIGKQPDDDRGIAEWSQFFHAYADDMAAATEQDFPIWENKVYRDRPRLCEGDGPVKDYRGWASQFYVDEGAEKGAEKGAGARAGTGADGAG